MLTFVSYALFLSLAFQSSQTKYTKANIDYVLSQVKETIELVACTGHALKTFKTMSGATFAMAPALIRAALKVKTAVPQSPVSGMFIVLLPWLYSPIVFVILNIFFQIIGNWQLLIGIIIYSFFPMLFFVIGMNKKVTRPFNDLEAAKFVKVFKIVQFSKVVLGGSFLIWGLFVFAFQENENYFKDYKERLVDNFFGVNLFELISMMAAKYYYTTIVGVDFLLTQILYARKHEVLMRMYIHSNRWKHSVHAQVAASIHQDYVKLLNIFCAIQDKNINYGEDARDGSIFEKKAKLRGLKKEEQGRAKELKKLMNSTPIKKGGSFFSVFFAKNRTDAGIHAGEVEMGDIKPPSGDLLEVDTDEEIERHGSKLFEQVNPMAMTARTKSKKGKKGNKSKKKNKKREAKEREDEREEEVVPPPPQTVPKAPQVPPPPPTSDSDSFDSDVEEIVVDILVFKGEEYLVDANTNNVHNDDGDIIGHVVNGEPVLFGKRNKGVRKELTSKVGQLASLNKSRHLK
mgnify:FL=1